MVFGLKFCCSWLSTLKCPEWQGSNVPPKTAKIGGVLLRGMDSLTQLGAGLYKSGMEVS